MVYSNADWFVTNELVEYFALSEEQADKYKPKISYYIDNFKKTTLPLLITKVETLEGQSIPLTAQQIESIRNELRQIWLQIVDQIAQDSALLLMELSDKQKKHFVNKMLENRQEISDIAKLPKDEFLSEYNEHLLERFEKTFHWLEEPTKAQENIYLESHRKSQEELNRDLEIRRNSLNNFFTSMKDISAQDLAAFVKKWARNPDLPGETHFADYQKRRGLRWQQFWEKMETSFSPAQRQERKTYLKEILEEMRSLQKS